MGIELTAQDIGEKLGLKKSNVYGVVSFLETSGLVKPIGVRKVGGSKGRGSTVYSCDPQLPSKVAQLFSQLFV